MAAAGNQDITSTQRAALAPPPAVAALSADGQRRLAQARDDINDAYEGQRLDFLDSVGKIVVHRFWDGDATKASKDDPLLLALLEAEGVKCSQPNLWYAVRLQTNPEEVFGAAGLALAVSHRRRLLHVQDDERRKRLAVKARDEGLSVAALEEAIKAARQPTGDQQKRGAKPLPPAARRFSPIGRALNELRNTSPAELTGLTPKRATEMLGQVEALKTLVGDWLPAFEAALRDVARDGAEGGGGAEARSG